MSKLTGKEVYTSLMDLDLILQDIGKMGPLKMFLDTIEPGNPALKKFHQEILAFTNRIEGLVRAVGSSG